jgi:hypothetical protein
VGALARGAYEGARRGIVGVAGTRPGLAWVTVHERKWVASGRTVGMPGTPSHGGRSETPSLTTPTNADQTAARRGSFSETKATLIRGERGPGPTTRSTADSSADTRTNHMGAARTSDGALDGITPSAKSSAQECYGDPNRTDPRAMSRDVKTGCPPGISAQGTRDRAPYIGPRGGR